MTRIFSILCAVVLVMTLAFAGCGGEEEEEEEEGELYTQFTDSYGEVRFYQLAWMESPEDPLYLSSNVGEVEFIFGAGAGEYLIGGGWLNAWIDTTAHNGTYQWALQNLYLSYPSEDFLLGSSPSVQFSLGLDNETPIDELEAAVFLSDGPLEGQPEGELVGYWVGLAFYLVGGEYGGGSEVSDIPLTIGSFNGSSSPVVRNVSICIPVKDVPAIEEGCEGCAPGAAARSISYLGNPKVCNFTTDDAQTIYKDLVVAMVTCIKCNCNSTVECCVLNPPGDCGCNETKLCCGTIPDLMLKGKNSYSGNHGFDIESELVWTTGYGGTMTWKNLTEKVKDALQKCCDVEIGIRWGGGGGHRAMVTFVADHADGSTTIGYVDDNQSMPGAQNNEHIIHTDNTGRFTDSTNSTVGSFMIECCNKTEEKPLIYDAPLEKAVRERLGIPEGPVYASDLAGLTSLEASGSGVADIRGLEYCTGLTELDLSFNRISDISPLVRDEGLGAGDVVYLSGNPLSPVSVSIYIPQLKARGVIVDYGRSSIAAGASHTVGLKSDGTVVAVGRNDKGQINVGGWTDIIQVAAGYLHTVGLKSDGTVVAVGRNDEGQCNVGNWTGIVQVFANGYYSVGLRSDGTLVAVGLNNFGQCNITGWSDIVQVAPGYLWIVGLKSDGTAVATGWCKDGQCNVDNWTKIIQVSADNPTVGLKEDGTLLTVGCNGWAQCEVGDWTGIIQVDAGQVCTVGLERDGTVVAVGQDNAGVSDVGTWRDIVQVAAGGGHIVGLRSDGTVVAAGFKLDGQCNVGDWWLG